MGIKPMFGNGLVADSVARFQRDVENATIYLLKYLGESLVKYARDRHNYTDRSGNLTNSIGYAVVRKSSIVYFAAGQQGAGADAALKTAMKMADGLPNAFSLIIVAGMSYAAYVEAKGYNVILPAELKAKRDFPATMQRLTARTRNKANELFGGTL